MIWKTDYKTLDASGVGEKPGMPEPARLLVVGSPALSEQVEHAIPECACVVEEHAIAGLWRAGNEDFDFVLVSFSGAAKPLRAVQAIREVAPRTRIIVACNPSDEPRAQNALRCGADDYVLEPLSREELRRALAISAGRRVTGGPSTAPRASEQELVRLGDVLQHLTEGPQAAAERIAEMLRDVFDAVGVFVRIDSHSATAGQVDEPVLQEPVRRDSAVIGEIVLARRAIGVYDAGAVARLAVYARLTEMAVSFAQQHQRLEDLAWTDDLSRLRNRRYFDRKLRELVARARKERLRVTVLLFDIDDFKSYNDRYGHQTGDELIRELAVLLTQSSRDSDIVARYGGDEFAVIFWDAEKPRVAGSQHPAAAMLLAERFCRVIHEHDFHCLGEKAPGPVTISGGLATFPWDGRDEEEVMRAADEALLAAKRDGKNRIALAGGEACSDDPGLPSDE